MELYTTRLSSIAQVRDTTCIIKSVQLLSQQLTSIEPFGYENNERMEISSIKNMKKSTLWKKFFLNGPSGIELGKR